MAWTRSSARIEYEIIDKNGRKATMSIPIAEATAGGKQIPDITKIKTKVGDLTGEVRNLSAGVMNKRRAVMVFSADFPPLTNTADPGSEVERKALFRFRMSDGTIGEVSIPAFDGTFFIGRNVDLTPASVQAFINGFITGFSGVRPCDSNGALYEELLSATVHNTRSRKRRIG